ncbi:MAG: hypothetical protein CL858_24765 [Cupriavidus sp.]|nr:hypothetical protein [Cupriavidus sp.]
MFFEIYASRQAQDDHRKTPHFRKFVETTQGMGRSRRFIENDVVQLTAKP